MNSQDQQNSGPPRWDSTRQRKTPFVAWLPFQKLDQPWKIKAALEAGAGAFAIIAVTHAVSAIGALLGPMRADTWAFGVDQTAVFTGNLVIGAIALGFWRLASRRPSALLSGFALVWSTIQLAPPLTYPFVGHGAPFILSFLGMLAALSGACGAYASRRASQTGDRPKHRWL